MLKTHKEAEAWPPLTTTKLTINLDYFNKETLIALATDLSDQLDDWATMQPGTVSEDEHTETLHSICAQYSTIINILINNKHLTAEEYIEKLPLSDFYLTDLERAAL